MESLDSDRLGSASPHFVASYQPMVSTPPLRHVLTPPLPASYLPLVPCLQQHIQHNNQHQIRPTAAAINSLRKRSVSMNSNTSVTAHRMSIISLGSPRNSIVSVDDILRTRNNSFTSLNSASSPNAQPSGPPGHSGPSSIVTSSAIPSAVPSASAIPSAIPSGISSSIVSIPSGTSVPTSKKVPSNLNLIYTQTAPLAVPVDLYQPPAASTSAFLSDDDDSDILIVPRHDLLGLRFKLKDDFQFKYDAPVSPPAHKLSSPLAESPFDSLPQSAGMDAVRNSPTPANTSESANKKLKQHISKVSTTSSGLLKKGLFSKDLQMELSSKNKKDSETPFVRQHHQSQSQTETGSNTKEQHSLITKLNRKWSKSSGLLEKLPGTRSDDSSNDGGDKKRAAPANSASKTEGTTSIAQRKRSRAVLSDSDDDTND